MIDNKVIDFIEDKVKSAIRYYRVIYNITATISLIPILIFAYKLPKIIYFQWSGYLVILQAALILTGLLFFAAGSRNYSFSQFIGIRQIINRSLHKSLSQSGNFKTDGILSVTRHPWYTAFLFLLWAGELNSTSLIINLVFSVYIVVGTYLEERKLIIEFGGEYIRYRQNVSMLLPFKWIRSYLSKYFIS